MYPRAREERTGHPACDVEVARSLLAQGSSSSIALSEVVSYVDEVIFPEDQPAEVVVGHLRVVAEVLLRQRAERGDASFEELQALSALDEARTWAEAEAIGAVTEAREAGRSR
jgi:hypothetical protein